jgi:predicted Zn-dependent protease with MMP-like domain
MISLEEFETIVQEITDTLPEEFFRELNGGVIIREQEKIHPASVGDDLFIMGEYQINYYLGRFVVLYYGSFSRCCGWYSENELRNMIRKVVLHEFRHHLESLAGERNLEIEDARELAAYKMRKMPEQNT